jgi:hypothetical protein
MQSNGGSNMAGKPAVQLSPDRLQAGAKVMWRREGKRYPSIVTFVSVAKQDGYVIVRDQEQRQHTVPVGQLEAQR